MQVSSTYSPTSASTSTCTALVPLNTSLHVYCFNKSFLQTHYKHSAAIYWCVRVWYEWMQVSNVSYNMYKNMKYIFPFALYYFFFVPSYTTFRRLDIETLAYRTRLLSSFKKRIPFALLSDRLKNRLLLKLECILCIYQSIYKYLSAIKKYGSRSSPPE